MIRPFRSFFVREVGLVGSAFHFLAVVHPLVARALRSRGRCGCFSNQFMTHLNGSDDRWFPNIEAAVIVGDWPGLTGGVVLVPPT